MLELGNKRKGDFVYKHFFEARGFRHVSVDWNGQDGSLKMDLRKPLNLGTFDMVTNFGTTEHVSENKWDGQVECWRNIAEAMHVGSVLISATPKAGTAKNHGTWYPQFDFFREFAKLNGMTVERLYEDGEGTAMPLIYARLVRTDDVQFQMTRVGMYHNNRLG